MGFSVRFRSGEEHNVITGTILAGGAGKRFNGIVKSKIVIGGRTIISRIIETFDGIFKKTIIVTNTPDEFNEYRSNKIVEDKFLYKGPLGGIHAALSESETAEIFVVAGDMPLLNRDLILTEIDYFYKNRCDILVPIINGHIEPLHGIYSKSVTGILEDYLINENDFSVRGFFSKCNVHYYQVEDSVENQRAFININSPLDIEEVEKFLGSGIL